MKAGQLDRVIEVQRMTTVIDDYGTPTQQWAKLVTLRAQKVQSSTDEYIRGAGATDETVIVFRTRHYDGITTADRVSYAGQFHNIKELKELGRRQGLEIRTQLLGTS